MFFKTKPLLYLQLFNHSLRYLAVHPSNHSVMDHDELVFETSILEDGEITNSSLLQTRLSALIQEKKWKNAKTSILVLNDFVTLREIEIPSQLKNTEIKDYLSLHMNQSIRMPFENPSVDYVIYDKTEDVQKLALIAYPSDKINQYQEILQNASLKPDVADVSALSLYRLADNQALINHNSDQHTMILQWHPGSNSIMVFNQKRPTFSRHSQQDDVLNSYEFTQNGKWQWKDSEAEYEISIDEQLNSLERFLDFYRYSVLDGEHGVSEIILTGAHPNLEELKARLTDRFELRVAFLDLPDTISQAESSLYGLILRNENKKNGRGKKRGIRK